MWDKKENSKKESNLSSNIIKKKIGNTEVGFSEIIELYDERKGIKEWRRFISR